MLYVYSDVVPSNYKYLVDYGSNYYVLSRSNRSYGESGDADYLDSYLCYLSPSFSAVNIDYVTYESRTYPDISSSLTDDLYYAKDFPIVIILSLSVLLCLISIFNGFTRLISRGGVVFPR